MRPSRTCARADLLLTDYVSGELSSRQARSLEAHLAQCERCRQGLLFLLMVLPALRTWRAGPSPSGLERRVMASISAAPPPAWKEAAILAILSLAILPAVPFILLFPIGLVAWMGVSVVAAVVTVWAAQYPNPEVKPWGMAAVAHEPSSPVPQ